jgi:DNA/RNA non-specific endonuclease/Big-like domain-containing protein
MSNMIPQAPDNNQGPWAGLEGFLRTLTDAGNEIYIVSGPAGVGGTGSNGGVTSTINTSNHGKITVPAQTWKAALVLPKADGDDVARVTASTRTIAVIMPNAQGIRNDDWTKYLKTVNDVEAICACNLFSNVPEAIRNAINAGTNGVNPPGAANESVSTSEDNAKSFTLDVANSTSDPLTYAIVSGPSHGALSGTDANRTYTPAPDFNGNDTFTFDVTNTNGTSNTATVSITISEVNDPPVANNDSKSVEAGSTLTFPASDLTANDSAGPNESSQTLTVTSVTGATLSGGQITFTPPVPYAGPASFTYQVCDNGTTAGVADPKCATATVNVTVGDTTPPAISDLAFSPSVIWPPNRQMVPVTVDFTVSDLGDPAPVCTLFVNSNEPQNGDWVVNDLHHIQLRADRLGTGNGRIYTIIATCTDASGNQATKSGTVTVPKNQK